MLLLMLLSCMAVVLKVAAEDTVPLTGAGKNGKATNFVGDILQNEAFESLFQTVADLKMTVAIQNKQIQDLQARDKEREKVVEELRMTVGDHRKQCGNKIRDDVGEVKQNDKFGATGDILDGHGNNMKTLNAIESVVKRRQIRQAENIAFTAYRDIIIDHMAHGHVIKMNQVLLNDGNGYSSSTGIFTVPISGVYLFNFHYNSHYRKTLVGLFVDGKNEVDAISVPKDSSQEMMGGNTAILKVTAGQSVWLQDIITDDGEIYSIPAARYATFSGVLLYMYT